MPLSFIINDLPEAINEALKLRLSCERENEDYVVIDDDSILFMDDSTTFEVRDVHTHISDANIGYPRKDRRSESLR